MREVETDYLVIGAGASGMAFVDSLIAHSDSEVVMIDRRHRPGGHWLDAYPFVRIHQTSANYGITSRVLGHDRIDESGPNAGFYERATAGEICDYYNRVMEEDFLNSGRVRFYAMSDYRGSDHDRTSRIASLLTGVETVVKVRRKIVDATYTESEVPSRHTPSFPVDPDVRFVTPNDLVNHGEPPSGYTIIGAGKTSMDTCCWLLDQGVAPDAIRWVRPRDAWIMNRAMTQPLELVGAFMQLQARWVNALAESEDGQDFAHRLEAADVFMRLDRRIEPEVFRGATLSQAELHALQQVENVIRLGKVRSVGADRVRLERGEISTDAGQLYIDCTAAGLRPVAARPIFEPERITTQVITPGILPWSAATIGVVEAIRDDDKDKNRLCPTSGFSGEVVDLLRQAHANMKGMLARGGEPDLAAWNEACRLNPGRGTSDHWDDPRVSEALASLSTSIGPAMSNLDRLFVHSDV